MAQASWGGNAGSPDDPVIQAFTHARFADMFISQNRRAQSGLLAAAAVIAYIWHARTGASAAVAWMAVALLVTALRYRYTERFVRAAAPGRTSARIAAVLLLNGVLMAVPLLAFPQLTELERAAVSIILLGSATASVATTAGYRKIFMAYAAPMLLPLALAWALTRGQTGAAPLGLAVLVLLFLLFLLSIGQQAQQTFEEASRFRYGEQQLNRELSRALDEAGEANRAKTQFLAAASHDLRQPLHSMNVLVAALTLRELDPRSREIVVLLDSVNQTLSRQLDSLLDISKLDAGTVKPQLAVLPLEQLLQSLQATTVPVARERGLQLVAQVPCEASVRTDGALLERVLGNLLDNAFKFTPRGGTVTLALRREADSAVLEVADTGIGIAPQEHQRVFREFYQVGNVQRDRSKGLGLGLSIVQRLCRLLAVELRLESTPGQGTCISLRLPLAEPVAPAARQAEPSQVPPGLAVLVVDDEELVRHSMQLLLSELACEVYLADGSAQAARICAEHRIDVVLSDHRLAGGDNGVHTIRTVLAAHPGARAALITGDTAPDWIHDAQSLGVPLLHKPVTLADLLTILRSGVP